MKLPKIRENLLVQNLNDEVLIYDLNTTRAYSLNSTAKAVFDACDGKKTSADLNLPEDLIYLSLDELKKQNLIEDTYVSPFTGMNRREVIRKVGLASMIALPVVSGLTAPTSAMAASAPRFGASCTSNAQCPSGTICTASSRICCAPGSDPFAGFQTICVNPGTCGGFRSQCCSGATVDRGPANCGGAGTECVCPRV